MCSPALFIVSPSSKIKSKSYTSVIIPSASADLAFTFLKAESLWVIFKPRFHTSRRDEPNPLHSVFTRSCILYDFPSLWTGLNKHMLTNQCVDVQSLPLKLIGGLTDFTSHIVHPLKRRSHVGVTNKLRRVVRASISESLL